MNFIMPHLPVLQVAIPLIAAPICVLFTFGGHRKLAWLFTLAVSWVCFLIAGALLSRVLLDTEISYAIGNWPPPFGIEYRVDPIKVIDLVDTTGAGDLFASGFLFGFTNNYSIEKCGFLGNKAASEIIKYIGARPKISLKSLDNEKNTLLGKSTISAIESGIFWGYVCMIEGLINKLKKYHSSPKVIATGGLSQVFKNNIKSIDLIEQNLTINGLAYFYLSQEKDI